MHPDQPTRSPGTGDPVPVATPAGTPDPTIAHSVPLYPAAAPAPAPVGVPSQTHPHDGGNHVRTGARLGNPTPATLPADTPLAAPTYPGYQPLRRLGASGDGEIWLFSLNPSTCPPAEACQDARLLAVKFYHHRGVRQEAIPLDVCGYEPLDYLGGGTYGEVLLYQDVCTGKRVAIKFFLRGGASQEWQLLQAEVKQLALLDDDPGIVHIKDLDPAAQPPYYIMTYAEHGSLARRLERGPMPASEALATFGQIAAALAYVHAKGVRHCDLKPGNILLDVRDRALVADFGQAHLASDMSPALGTFFYMAPEQATLENTIADTRWDVYGLGALFYAMVVGRPPHEDQGMRATIASTGQLARKLQSYRDWVVSSPRPMAHRRVPGVDRRLADIIERCLEVDPSRRLRDAGAVLTELQRRERQRRRRPLLVFGLIAPVLLLLLMTIGAALVGASTLGQTENALSDQLRGNDLVMARLVANIVAKELHERVSLLEHCAGDPDLLRALKDKAPRRQLRELLQQYMAADGEQNRDTGRDSFFFKWTLADRNGFIIADEIEEAELHGKSFAWRDWFNGAGSKPARKQQWFSPVEKTHISQPYVAEGIDENNETNPLCLSISSPIRDPRAGKKVIALLVGTMRFGQVAELIRHIGLDVQDGAVVIVTDRKYCVLHRDLEAIKRRIKSPESNQGENPDPLEGPLLTELIDNGREGTTEDYVDPVTGHECLAAYAPIMPWRWGVVVQHERRAALEPVTRLRGWMSGWGMVIFVTMSLVTTGLWGGLIWTLRKEERPANG